MTRYKFRNPSASYFITLTVKDWIDLFTRDVYRQIVIKNLEYCQQHKGLIIHGWVIMSNHLHLLVRASEDHDLAAILRNFKKHCSKELYHEIERSPYESRKKWLLALFRENKGIRLWKLGNHPIELFNQQIALQKLDYIHENPVRNHIVDSPEKYFYSSARFYAGEPGLLQIEPI